MAIASGPANETMVPITLQLFAFRVILHDFFCHPLIFLQKLMFQKILSGIQSVCQTAWVQIRPDKMSGLIWIPTV